MRPQDPVPSLIATGDLVLDLVRKDATVGGQRVHLKSKEYPLLELLSLHKHTVATREALIVHLYGAVDTPETKLVDIFMDKLRGKLAHSTARIVETSFAGVVGFRLIGPPAASGWRDVPPEPNPAGGLGP
jgi:DNA-binding response OmpR family regulator